MAWTEYRRLFAACCRQPYSILLGSLLLLSGCDRANEDSDLLVPDVVRIQLDYFPEASHGGLYQAKLKRFYAEAGIAAEVEIITGGNGVYPMQQVALGKADFGIGRLDDLLMAIERGLPLKAVAATYQHDPQALMFHPGQGIHNFVDLDARRVMAIPGSGFIAWIERKYGISIRVIPLNYDISQFMVDEELTQQCYITSQPYYVQKNGAEVETLLIADSGYDPFRVLYVNTKFSEKYPEMVRGVRVAVLRGISDYLLGDRTQTDALLFELNSINQPDLNAYTVEKIKEFHLAFGKKEEGEALGLIDTKRLDAMIELLLEIGMLEKKLAFEDVVDASILNE